MTCTNSARLGSARLGVVKRDPGHLPTTSESVSFSSNTNADVVAAILSIRMFVYVSECGLIAPSGLSIDVRDWRNSRHLQPAIRVADSYIRARKCKRNQLWVGSRPLVGATGRYTLQASLTRPEMAASPTDCRPKYPRSALLSDGGDRGADVVRLKDMLPVYVFHVSVRQGYLFYHCVV